MFFSSNLCIELCFALTPIVCPLFYNPRMTTEAKWTMGMIWSWSRTPKATQMETARRTITIEGFDRLTGDQRRTLEASLVQQQLN